MLDAAIFTAFATGGIAVVLSVIAGALVGGAFRRG